MRSFAFVVRGHRGHGRRGRLDIRALNQMLQLYRIYTQVASLLRQGNAAPAPQSIILLHLSLSAFLRGRTLPAMQGRASGERDAGIP
jgi:hypothetical protein